jgi:hypothetical protein
MNLKRWSVLGASVVAMALAACGGSEAEPVEQGVTDSQEQAVRTLPQCCTTQSRDYTEAFCDAVAYSADRCNGVALGKACQWTCGQPGPQR